MSVPQSAAPLGCLHCCWHAQDFSRERKSRHFPFCLGYESNSTHKIRYSNLSIENTTGRRPLPQWTFYFFHALTITCLILIIVGITGDMSPEALLYPDIKIKVGTILYVVSWAIMCLFLTILVRRRDSLEKGERRILLAVLISAPLILVRILYSVFMWFLHHPDFSLFDGNITVQLVMAVLEEIIVVIACLAVGITLRVRDRTPPKEAETAASYQLLDPQAPKP